MPNFTSMCFVGDYYFRYLDVDAGWEGIGVNDSLRLNAARLSRDGSIEERFGEEGCHVIV